MDKLSIINKYILFEAARETLINASLNTQSILVGLANNEDLTSLLAPAFGDGFDGQKLSFLTQNWLENDFSNLPEIEILSGIKLNGANGAFSQATNRIYISQDYLIDNFSSTEAIVNLFLEEFGHFIDREINEIDSTGDEGKIFAEIAQGQNLSVEQLQALQAEDDSGTIEIDGETVLVEQALDDVLSEVTETVSGLVNQFKEIENTVESFNNDLQQYLEVIQSFLDTNILARNLPIIGDELEGLGDRAVNFIDGISNEITTNLARISGLANLSPDLIRNELVKVLSSQGVSLEDLLPDDIKTSFTTEIESLISGDRSIADIIPTALEAIRQNLLDSGVLAGVLPESFDNLNSGELTDSLLELGKEFLSALAAQGSEDEVEQAIQQLRDSLITAISNLGILNLESSVFEPVRSVIDTLKSDIADNNDFNSFSDKVTSALEGLSAADFLTNSPPDLASVLAAANLNADNFNTLADNEVLQRIFAGINQLNALDTTKLDPTDVAKGLFEQFQGQINKQIDLPEALRSLIDNGATGFQNLIAGENPNLTELFRAVVPALIDERIENLLSEGASGEEIVSQFSTPQIASSLVTLLSSLDVFNLENFIPLEVVTDLIDTFRSELANGASLTDALRGAVQPALVALDELGVFPSSFPSLSELDDLQDEILANFSGEKLATFQALSNTEKIEEFRQILFKGFAALEQLGIDSFIPTEAIAGLFTTFHTQLDNQGSVTEALANTIEELDILDKLQDNGVFSGLLPNIEEVSLQTILDLGESSLTDLAQAQLQRGLLEGLNLLGSLDFERIIPQNIIELFNGIETVEDLTNALDSALTGLNSADLLVGDIPEVDALLTTDALKNINQADLARLSDRDLFTRVFSAVNELEAFDLNRFIPLETANDLITNFESRLTEGIDLLDSLRQTVTEAIAQFSSLNLLEGGTPTVASLLKSALPEFIPDELTNLSADNLRQSFFDALANLDVLDLDRFISDDLASSLLNTFEGKLSEGESLVDALGSVFEAASQSDEFLERLVGEIPLVEDVIKDLVPQLSSLLNGGLGGIISQVAGIESLTNLSPQFVLRELVNVLNDLEVFDLEEIFSPDTVTRFETVINEEQSVSDALRLVLSDALNTLGVSTPLADLNDTEALKEVALNLGRDILRDYTPQQLQRGIFDAITQVGALDLSAIAQGQINNLLTDLENIDNVNELSSAIDLTLPRLDNAGLLNNVPSSQSIIEQIDPELISDLSNSSSEEILQQILTATVNLNAFDIAQFIPLEQIQTLLNQFERAISGGANLTAALESLVEETISSFSGIFNSDIPSVEQLFSIAVPALLDRKLEGLSVEEITAQITPDRLLQGLLSGVGELNLLNNVIPLSFVRDLVNTFQTALSGDSSLTNALTSSLEQFVSALDDLGLISSVPSTDDVIEEFIPQISGVLGQLSGLVDRILTPPINAIRIALFETLGDGGLGLLPDELTSADDLSDLIPKTVLNGFLRGANSGDLAGSLQTSLEDALGPIGLGILERGEQLADDALEEILAGIEARISDPLNSLVGLESLIESTFDEIFGVGVVDVTSNQDVLSFNLNLNERQTFGDVNLDQDLGLPGLGLQVDGEASLGIDYGLMLGLGFDLEEQELFLDTSANEELSIDLDASLDQLDALAELGFLQFDAATNENPNQASFDFSIDLSEDDNKLTFAELSAIDLSEIFAASLGGGVDINLDLATRLISPVLPSIATEFAFDWDLNGDNIDSAFSTIPNIDFNNIELDVGTFLKGFGSTILNTIQTVTEPLDPFLDLLTQDVPIINQSLVDFAQFADQNPTIAGVFDESTLDFINDLANVVELIDLINNAGDFDGTIDLGSFEISGVDVFEEEGTSNGLTTQNLIQPLSLEGGTPTQTRTPDQTPEEQLNEQNSDIGNNLAENDRFELPILTDPAVIPNLLLGKPDVNLFRLNLPPLKLGFEYKQTIPIIGPIVAIVGGEVGAAASFTIGFDSLGLQQFQDSGFTNPTTIAEGFFLTTQENIEPPSPLDPNDISTLGVAAGITAGVGADVGAISAGVEAKLVGGAFLDLIEEKTRIPDFADPGCLFEFTGALEAVLAAEIKIGFGFFSYTKRVQILRERLADATIDPCAGDVHEDRNQATRDPDTRILTLNSSNSPDFFRLRSVGGSAGNEDIEVFKANNDPNSEAISVPFIYKDILQIEGNGRNGDDIILTEDNVLSAVFLQGNSGSDELTGGSNNDSLEGGSGDDFLEGRAGNDTLDGGNQEETDTASYAKSSNGVNINLSVANPFAFDGEGGNDTIINIERIEGSRHNDSIVAGNVVEVLDGLEGDDSLIGRDDKDDFLIGGAGADTLDGRGEGNNGDAVSYLENNAGVSVNLQTDLVFSGGGSDADGDVLIEIENVQGTIYQDALVGDAENNILSGENSNDTVEGGKGADSLDGGAGIDLLSYAGSTAGVDVSLIRGTGLDLGVDSDGSDDEIAKIEDRSTFENLDGSNANDILEGDIQNNIIRGLAGDDEIKGEAGDDTLSGGAGADIHDGGLGIDLADYSDSAEGVNVDFLATGTSGDAEGDTFVLSDPAAEISTVENLLGSSFADRLLGGNGDNEINSGLSQGAIDFVDGRGGSDRLFVDYSLNDVGAGVFGGFNFEEFALDGLFRFDNNNNNIIDAVQFQNIENLTVIGTIQDDDITASSGDDLIVTSDGNDRVIGGRGSNVIITGDGDDLVVDQNQDGTDSIFGDGGEGFIVLNGGAGIDTLSVNLSARNQNIVLESFAPDIENSNQLLTLDDGSIITQFEVFKDIKTGDGIDRLTQLGRVDNFFDLGGGFVNIANPGLGLDRVIAEPGENFNFLVIDYSVDDIGEGILSDTANATNGGTFFRRANDGSILDRVIFSGMTVFNITGTSQSDELIGGNRGDNLIGNSGNDLFVGNAGNDFLDGGEGNDDMRGDTGSDVLIGGAGDDTLQGTFFQANFPTEEIDRLTGGIGADRFVLGDRFNSFYADNTANETENTRAQITDFNPNEGDTLVLQGFPGQYFVTTENGSTLLLRRDSTGDDVFTADLIAVLENFTDFDLNADYIDYEQIIIGITDSDTEETTVDRSAVEVTITETEDTPVTLSNQTNSENSAIITLTEGDSFVVTRNNDSASLLQSLLGDTTGLSDFNLDLVGDARAFGTFVNDPFGLEEGIVLSTGRVEDLDDPNTVDGDFSPGITTEITFTQLEGSLTTPAGTQTGVFVADLSDLGFELQSLQIADSGSGTGGAGGIFSGFDLDAVKLSRTRITSAAEIQDLPGLENVFDFSALGTFLTPGTQRPTLPIGANLQGTINGFVNNGIATLEDFDSNSSTDNPSGFFSIGDGGEVGFNLNSAVSTEEPLFLYIGESGNNGELAGGEITVSNRPLGESAETSTDFGLPGVTGDEISMEIDFFADETAENLFFEFVFGSEEFVEFAGSEFNDMFSLELNGFNLARLSDGDAATINNLALSPLGQFHPDFIYNPAEVGEASQQTSIDGYTEVLSFAGALLPNQRNTLTITVKDVRDGLLDSAVFLRGGTFGTVEPVDTDIDYSIATITESIVEGDSGSQTVTFEVERTGGINNASTVEFTITGSATSEEDYNTLATSGAIGFAENETTQTITVDVLGDTEFEADEEIIVTLSNPTAPGNATISVDSATTTIVNDDSDPTLNDLDYSIATNTESIVEGDSGSQTVTFEVERTGGINNASTVEFTITGSATSEEDYNTLATSGAIGFAENETTQTITVDVLGDTEFEADEEIIVTLSNPTAPGNATISVDSATTTIVNDDAEIIGKEIIGTFRRDELIGTPGDDRITGLQAGDTLTGGDGSDVFIYESIVDGGDVITDFQVGVDLIDLSVVLNSLEDRGTDPIADGFVQFGTDNLQDSFVIIDPDGITGNAESRLFILVENIAVNDLANPDNFIF